MWFLPHPPIHPNRSPVQILSVFQKPNRLGRSKPDFDPSDLPQIKANWNVKITIFFFWATITKTSLFCSKILHSLYHESQFSLFNRPKLLNRRRKQQRIERISHQKDEDNQRRQSYEPYRCLSQGDSQARIEKGNFFLNVLLMSYQSTRASATLRLNSWNLLKFSISIQYGLLNFIIIENSHRVPSFFCVCVV